MDSNKLHEPDSFLGLNPKCDICDKQIEAGEKVKQTIVGITTLTETGVSFPKPDTPEISIKIETEMGIIEQQYSLVHVDCENRVKVN